MMLMMLLDDALALGPAVAGRGQLASCETATVALS